MSWNIFVRVQRGLRGSMTSCCVLVMGVSTAAQEVHFPTADGSIVDGGSFGPSDGIPDAVDWTFNQSGFEGAITLVTTPGQNRLEHRLVWEYDLGGLAAIPPVSATLTFTLRGRPAFPIPDVQVHVYAYPGDLAESVADYSAGPAVLQCSVTVVAYEEATYTVAVTDAVIAALLRGDDGVGFRFQIRPGTEADANQAFVDALDEDDTTKPFLTISEALPADADGDGVPDVDDLCMGFDDRFDADDDGLADGCDNCPDVANSGQADGDADGVGDACSDTTPPPPDDGGSDGGNPGGGTGGGTGGGGDTPPPPITPAPDMTDEFGDFAGQVIGDGGRLLAELTISGAPAGRLVSYELEDGSSLSDAPGPNGGIRVGFGDGVALGRTFTVDFDAPPGSYTATIAIRFTDDELASVQTEAGDLQLHVLDTSQSQLMWIRAGVDVGLSQPTGVVGESGYYRAIDLSWVFWAVRDELSSFALGAPFIEADDEVVEPSETDEPDGTPEMPDVDDSKPDDPVPIDTDSDGVVDESDLCPQTEQGARVDEDGCPIEQPQPQDVNDSDPAPTRGGLCGMLGMISLSLTVLGLGQMKLTSRRRQRFSSGSPTACRL